MSRGLGKIQRGLLLALARIEVRAAEGAAQEQRQYRPPTRAGIRRVFYVACQHELREPLVAKMRDEYGLQLAIDQILEITAEGDQDDAFKLKALRGRKRREFPDPRRARDDRRDQRDWLDDRLSPSRALASLRRRGFIGVAEPDWGVRLRIGVRLRRGIVLRPAGLIKARRLGLPDTDIVDLDRLTEQLKKAAAAPAH